MAVTVSLFNQGFECCEMMFCGCYLEIGAIIEPLIPVSTSIEERVSIMRARRARLMEALNFSYVYFPKQ